MVWLRMVLVVVEDIESLPVVGAGGVWSVLEWVAVVDWFLC